MITTITMNASVDKAYFMEQVIENGTVMRVAQCKNTAGGKGLNVARAAARCGAKVQASGLLGGFNGQYVEAMLTQDGIQHQFVHILGETRSCINILDERYGSTEYLEPGCEVSAQEEAEFMRQYPKIIEESDVVAISGSVPKGMSKDLYGQMVTIAKEMGKKVILDTSGENLKQGIKVCPTLVKPNQDEIEQLFGIKLHSLEEVISYAWKIYDQGIPYVVISMGSKGAVLLCSEGMFEGIAPKIEAVNTVGCGDSMVGALAVALERKDTPEQALRFAMAVAASNALSPNTGDVDPKVYEALMDQITVTKKEEHR